VLKLRGFLSSALLFAWAEEVIKSRINKHAMKTCIFNMLFIFLIREPGVRACGDKGG